MWSATAITTSAVSPTARPASAPRAPARAARRTACVPLRPPDRVPRGHLGGAPAQRAVDPGLCAPGLRAPHLQDSPVGGAPGLCPAQSRLLPARRAPRGGGPCAAATPP